MKNSACRLAPKAPARHDVRRRGFVMSSKRSVAILAALVGSLCLSGCIGLYEGADSVCPQGNPNADNWPYCGPAQPGGSQPRMLGEKHTGA